MHANQQRRENFAYMNNFQPFIWTLPIIFWRFLVLLYHFIPILSPLFTFFQPFQVNFYKHKTFFRLFFNLDFQFWSCRESVCKVFCIHCDKLLRKMKFFLRCLGQITSFAQLEKLDTHASYLIFLSAYLISN